MPSIEDVRDKVRRILTSHFRPDIRPGGEIYVGAGSTGVWINVEEGIQDNINVTLRAMLLRDVKITPELTFDIATLGLKVGNLWLWVDPENPGMGNLWNTWTLLGNYLDEEELMQALLTIGSFTDGLDDEWQAKHGGSLLIDN